MPCGCVYWLSRRDTTTGWVLLSRESVYARVRGPFHPLLDKASQHLHRTPPFEAEILCMGFNADSAFIANTFQEIYKTNIAALRFNGVDPAVGVCEMDMLNTDPGPQHNFWIFLFHDQVVIIDSSLMFSLSTALES